MPVNPVSGVGAAVVHLRVNSATGQRMAGSGCRECTVICSAANYLQSGHGFRRASVTGNGVAPIKADDCMTVSARPLSQVGVGLLLHLQVRLLTVRLQLSGVCIEREDMSCCVRECA